MSFSRSRTMSSALLLAGALVMTGCSNGDQTPAASGGGGGGGGGGEVEKVGLMLQDIYNLFFASMQSSMEADADADVFELNVQVG